MRRQLLTLLALLTGLAAIGTPANAAMGEVFGAQVQSGSQSSGEERGAEIRQRKSVEHSPARCGTIVERAPRRQTAVHLPTVMLGSDISLE
ncbi:MAG: hypothetical protein HKO05_03285 [Erythrobacter sp.]|jgi:hypothetical protein|nr:hypothetical protein [Erythrobacter sp.]RZV34055.1 MAG: hypothetical protein EX262_05410 [Sphingomonadaceae bacterium]